MQGAADIICEELGHHVQLKQKLRELFWDQGEMVSKKRDDAPQDVETMKYKDFFDYREKVESLKNKKSSHRFMAQRRGMLAKILTIEVELAEPLVLTTIKSMTMPDLENSLHKDLLLKLILRAYKLYLHPSLDLEIKTELKKCADEAAIDVFGQNLRNLLLQPYLGPKAVMAIDPGQRTGCKIAVIDATGKLQVDTVIYPHPPQSDEVQSKTVVEKLIAHFAIEYISIGNGTAGRETLSFLEENVEAVKNEKVKAVLVNEAGASVYSASDVAREEFPDKDITVRGAVSIGRRLQDPLAELVKIDPKAIGVGQYQHDVNQMRLKKQLESVVESCVNFVGVDLNTASAYLLSFISGIGPTLSKAIVQYREKNGAFKSRAQLLSIARFSEKIFTQSAGFLRIYGGENHLDSTFIHPEKYELIQKWCDKNKIAVSELVSSPEVISKMEKDSQLMNEVGELTFKDILTSLKAAKQDPRKEFTNVAFSKSLKNFKDLKVNEWHVGIINNITQFGAFVDLGLKESGLLHVSEMGNEFVKDPFEKFQVGQEVRVRVSSIDADRKRISLSLKTNISEAASSHVTTAQKIKHIPHKSHEVGTNQFGNRAFAGLAGFGKK
jgi:uncharacterized protein